uniref:Testis expressed 10 n=1 Tax=Erpetoichthys calabaricus TaxID=27687 RepID=A0A8C4T0T1_ERPCA
MTKKRKRQDDFQKVKLRVGKRKAKPDNTTNVNFRTKAIHITEQLKTDQSLPATHRKLNIKDLLSQMHHYSAGVKQSALSGLKELLTQHSFVLQTHLSSILSEVTAVFTDKDPPVRSAAIRLLQSLAVRIPPKHIAPFFPLVSAHLSSAMTHITEAIQEDALNVLDILLEHYPELLTSCSSVLLKNFVELISHQRYSKTLKTPGWILSVNPDRKYSSQKWRLSVLTRLCKFLQALVDQQPTAGQNCRAQADTLEIDERKSSASQISPLDITWEEHSFGTEGIQLFENSGSQPNVKSCFQLRTSLGLVTVAEEGLTSAESLKSFIQTLIPILFECWIEACPEDRTGTTPGNLLEPDCILLLYHVLSIICLLRQLATTQNLFPNMESWFRGNYLNDFKNRFMKYFPYSEVEIAKHRNKGVKRDKSASGSLAGVDTLSLNLMVCRVMVPMTNSALVQQDSVWLSPIRMFVTQNLSCDSKLNTKELTGLLQVVWRLAVTQRNKAVTEELLRAVQLQYQQRSLIMPIRILLLRFFRALYLLEKEANPQIAKSKVLSRWLAKLPLQLAQLGPRNAQLSAHLIEIIHAAASRANKELLQGLQAQICHLYDPDDGAFVLLPHECQQKLVQLLYFLPSLPCELLSCLSHCCNGGRFLASLAASLIRIVHIRSSFVAWVNYNQEVAVSDADYFSFLFSCLTGFAAEDLNMLQRSSDVYQTQLSPIFLYLTDVEKFMHHWDVAEEVCLCLATISSRTQCLDILQNAICKNLANLQVIPDSTAAAVLHAVSKLLDLAYIPSEVLLRFLANCCCSVLLLMLEESDSEEQGQKREAMWGACLEALSSIPRVLRLMLQSLRVTEACQEVIPVVARMIRLLLQHTQLRNHMLANSALLQQIIQEIMRCRSGDSREQWFAELQYCFSVFISGQSRGTSATQEMY